MQAKTVLLGCVGVMLVAAACVGALSMNTERVAPAPAAPRSFSEALRLQGEKTPLCQAAFAMQGRTCEDNWFMQYSCTCDTSVAPIMCKCSADKLAGGGIALVVCLVLGLVAAITACCYCCHKSRQRRTQYTVNYVAVQDGAQAGAYVPPQGGYPQQQQGYAQGGYPQQGYAQGYAAPSQTYAPHGYAPMT